MERRKFRWHNGNGEIIGFAFVAVFLFFIMLAVTTITAYATHAEQLTVMTYCAGRAACVSHTKAFGETRAKSVIDVMSDGDVTFQIKTLNGSWKTGNLMTIEVTQPFPAIFPFNGQDQVCKLTMMIEGKEK